MKIFFCEISIPLAFVPSSCSLPCSTEQFSIHLYIYQKQTNNIRLKRGVLNLQMKLFFCEISVPLAFCLILLQSSVQHLKDCRQAIGDGQRGRVKTVERCSKSWGRLVSSEFFFSLDRSLAPKSSNEDFSFVKFQYPQPLSHPLAVFRMALNNSVFSPISDTSLFKFHVIYR